MERLNGNSGLLLWLYLDKNADGYRLELSQKACEAWGIKRDSYYRAVKELQEKGYLQETGGGRYIFHEVSTAQEATGGHRGAAEAWAEDLPQDTAEATQRATGTGGGAGGMRFHPPRAAGLCYGRNRNGRQKARPGEALRHSKKI